MLSCGACTEQAETKMWHGYPRGAAGTAGDQGLLLLISQYMHKISSRSDKTEELVLLPQATLR